MVASKIIKSIAGVNKHPVVALITTGAAVYPLAKEAYEPVKGAVKGAVGWAKNFVGLTPTKTGGTAPDVAGPPAPVTDVGLTPGVLPGGRHGRGYRGPARQRAARYMPAQYPMPYPSYPQYAYQPQAPYPQSYGYQPAPTTGIFLYQDPSTGDVAVAAQQPDGTYALIDGSGQPYQQVDPSMLTTIDSQDAASALGFVSGAHHDEDGVAETAAAYAGAPWNDVSGPGHAAVVVAVIAALAAAGWWAWHSKHMRDMAARIKADAAKFAAGPTPATSGSIATSGEKPCPCKAPPADWIATGEAAPAVPPSGETINTGKWVPGRWVGGADGKQHWVPGHEEAGRPSSWGWQRHESASARQARRPEAQAASRVIDAVRSSYDDRIANLRSKFDTALDENKRAKIQSRIDALAAQNAQAAAFQQSLVTLDTPAARTLQVQLLTLAKQQPGQLTAVFEQLAPQMASLTPAWIMPPPQQVMVPVPVPVPVAVPTPPAVPADAVIPNMNPAWNVQQGAALETNMNPAWEGTGSDVEWNSLVDMSAGLDGLEGIAGLGVTDATIDDFETIDGTIATSGAANDIGFLAAIERSADDPDADLDGCPTGTCLTGY